MRTILLFISITIGSLTISNAQWGNSKKVKGNGSVTSETRNTSTYNGIEVKGHLDVLLIEKEGDISIKGESNLLKYIITEVQNGILQIYIQNGYSIQTSKDKKLLITVLFKDLNMINLSGSGDITSVGVINSENFKTNISGSGDISLEITAKSIESSISGSGDIKLKGTTDFLSCIIKGSGDISAYSVQSNDATAIITGSGDIKISVKESLKGRIKGSGNIYYKGDPIKLDTKIAGSGNITKT